MSSTSPPITVLMSCYNGQDWIADAIKSVLNQTFEDFEFVIIDDGSTDNSVHIINTFSNIDHRIRVIEKNNTGLPDSLNIGLEKAQGKWIARIDADDICEPNRLEKQFEFANSDTSLVLIGSAYIQINKDGEEEKLQIYPESHQDLKRNLLHNKRFFAHSSAFFKTEIVREIGGYRPRIKKAEDYDLWLRLSEFGKMICIKDPLIRFRCHPNQISHEDSGKRQIIDGRVALTSYWIRKLGYPDPVNLSDKEFHQYRKWVESKIKKSKLFEYRKFVSQIKFYLANGEYFKVFKKCLGSPIFVWRYIAFVIRGEDISRNLAKEWIRKRLK